MNLLIITKKGLKTILQGQIIRNNFGLCNSKVIYGSRMYLVCQKYIQDCGIHNAILDPKSLSDCII